MFGFDFWRGALRVRERGEGFTGAAFKFPSPSAKLPTMMHVAGSPTLLLDVVPDIGKVVGILEANAPYTPLGGWFWPGGDGEVATRSLWFQNDWVHDDRIVSGADLFLNHEEVTVAAQRFYDAEIVVPHTLYVNIMGPIEKCGPAHTDNPIFQGRSRVNTPMQLLRTMFWSGLFDRWAIRQATSIWWMNDVEGGGFRYWPGGPQKSPARHVGKMANTALVGDNHGMFHQVEPVGPFEEGTPLVTGGAELAPTADGSGDWAVTDRGEVRYRAPLQSYRVSVLWKANIYTDEEERQRLEAEPLSLEEVARVFSDDLSARGSDLRLDLDRLEDPVQAAAFAEIYPEARPIEAGPSLFDAYR